MQQKLRAPQVAIIFSLVLEKNHTSGGINFVFFLNDINHFISFLSLVECCCLSSESNVKPWTGICFVSIVCEIKFN